MTATDMTSTDMRLPVGCIDCLYTGMVDLTRTASCPDCGSDNLDLNDRALRIAADAPPWANGNGNGKSKKKRKKKRKEVEDDGEYEDVEDEFEEVEEAAEEGDEEDLEDEFEDVEDEYEDLEEEVEEDDDEDLEEEEDPDEIPGGMEDGEEEAGFQPGGPPPVPPEQKQTPRAETDEEPGPDLDGIPDELIAAIVKGDVQRAIEMLTQLPKGIQPMASRWVAAKVGSQRRADALGVMERVGSDEDYDRYYRNFMADGMTPMSRDEWDRVRREDEVDAEWQRKHHPYNGPLSSKRHADALGADPAILLDTDGDPVMNPSRTYLPGGGAFLWDRREAQQMIGQVAQGHTRPVDRAVSSSDYYLRFRDNWWRAMPRNAERRQADSDPVVSEREPLGDGWFLEHPSQVKPGWRITHPEHGEMPSWGTRDEALAEFRRRVSASRQANSWGDPQFPFESTPVTKVRQKIRSIHSPFEEAEMELSQGEAPPEGWTVAGPTIDTHIGPKQKRLYPGIETTSSQSFPKMAGGTCPRCGYPEDEPSPVDCDSHPAGIYASKYSRDSCGGRRHAKIMAIASDVLSTNPNLPSEEALRVATRTVDSHPEVIGSRKQALGKMVHALEVMPGMVVHFPPGHPRVVRQVVEGDSARPGTTIARIDLEPESGSEYDHFYVRTNDPWVYTVSN